MLNLANPTVCYQMQENYPPQRINSFYEQDMRWDIHLDAEQIHVLQFIDAYNGACHTSAI